jgi:hypothetical protein
MEGVSRFELSPEDDVQNLADKVIATCQKGVASNFEILETNPQAVKGSIIVRKDKDPQVARLADLAGQTLGSVGLK